MSSTARLALAVGSRVLSRCLNDRGLRLLDQRARYSEELEHERVIVREAGFGFSERVDGLADRIRRDMLSPLTMNVHRRIKK